MADWCLFWNTSEGISHVIRDHRCKPVFFKTRLEAREYANDQYGYIKEREDLRREPHNWRMPEPKRVRVILDEQ